MNTPHVSPTKTAINELGVTPVAPWLGLRSFTESVRDYFYGRDAEIQELFEGVQHRTLTVLFGQSGLGKTSLLRAGLIPPLHEAKYTPFLIRLVHDEAAEPLDQQVIHALTGSWSTCSLAPPKSLWEMFHDPAVLPNRFPRNPVLIFDQFEELFTLGEAKRPEDARRFLEALACLVENRPPAAIRAAMDQDDDLADRLLLGPQPCKVLLALRDDFLHRLERGRRQMPSMMDNRLELRLLSGPQAYRAVYEPGGKRRSHPIVTPETATAIVRFVAGAAADTPLEEIDNVPPLLSLICEQLNARRLANGEPEIRAESLAQSAPEVLRDFYDTSFAPHSAAVREFVEDELVSASGFRESKTLDTAKSVLSSAGVPDPEIALRHLVDQRLLVIEDRGGVARVELTHDILAPIAAAARKERAEREAQVEAERRLVIERNKRRLFMAVTGVMTVLMVAAAASGIVAWRKAGEAGAAAKKANDEFNRANEANALHLAQLHRASMADRASARKASQEDYDAQRKGQWAASIGNASKWHEAVTLWVRAFELEPANADAGYWLYDTLLKRGHAKCNVPRNTLRHDADVMSASFSPDGTRVVTVSKDNTARIWDVATGKSWGEPLRHGNLVKSASFSPDGTRVVTASDDHTARIWDATTGQPVVEPLRHDNGVVSASFSPDGTRVVTASDDHTARIWDAATGMPVGEPLRHGEKVTSATFSPDGTRVVTASWDDTARIWDATTGKPVGEPLRHDNGVVSASFSPDGTRVVTASWDKTARIWNAATGKPVGEPLLHNDPVMSANFSPDGTRVVTASWDRTARIWDAATGMPLGEPLLHNDPVMSANFSPDGTRVVTASWDRTARIWNAATGKPVGEPLRHDDNVLTASFSPDGTRVVTASDDHTARIWDVATGKPLGELLRHGEEVTGASFSPDGKRVVTASRDNTARIWDAATGKPLGEPLRHDKSVVKGVVSASFSPDGTRVVTASWDDTARIWDATTGKPVGEPLRHDNGVVSASYSPDGTRVVTASLDNMARIWDAATGKPLGEPLGEPLRHDKSVVKGVVSPSFSPDGTRVVTASGSTARIWDAATGKSWGEPLRHDKEVYSASFSPEGTCVVTASADDTARIWDAATGKPLGEPLRHDNGVVSASFSPDGTRVVTASWDKTARIWNAATGKPVGEPLRHDEPINSASFSLDGTRVVSASWDRTARIWEAATGKPVGEPLRHDDNVRTAWFSPDGTRVVTASDDHTARIWEIPSIDEQQEIVQISPEIRDWAQAISGLQFTEDGELRTLPWDNTSQDRKEAALPRGPWAELAAWLKTNGPQQTLSPKSKHTLRQVAERERDFGSRKGLESALQYDPTVPLARMQLANVLEEEELAKTQGTPDAAVLARAAHWRRYDLDRLPNDPNLRTRAAEILLQLPQAKVGVGPQPITAAEAAQQLIPAVPVGK